MIKKYSKDALLHDVEPKFNVIRRDFNRGGFWEYNVFNHGRLREDLEKGPHKYDLETKTFDTWLKGILQYCFWSKCEYELILTPWPPTSDGKEDEKIDIYDQVMMNFDLFAMLAAAYFPKAYNKFCAAAEKKEKAQWETLEEQLSRKLPSSPKKRGRPRKNVTKNTQKEEPKDGKSDSKTV